MAAACLSPSFSLWGHMSHGAEETLVPVGAGEARSHVPCLCPQLAGVGRNPTGRLPVASRKAPLPQSRGVSRHRGRSSSP